MDIETVIREYLPQIVHMSLGTAKLLEPGTEQNTAAACLQERLQPPVDILVEAQNSDSKQLYKITVDNFYVFGKLDTEGGKKYQLHWNGGEK